MHQAWHIFKKDVRYLQREIAFLLALAVALYWLGSHGLRGDASDAFGVLLAVAAGYTIARLVHAEALPGENQFWITRPYRWQSLLAAKILFMLAFINLPILLAQAAVLLVAGFPIAWIAPGLLWMQVLVLICVVLPLALIAALTDGMATFFGCILVIALIGFGQYSFTMWSRFTTPAPMEWLHDSVGYAALAVFAPPVLYLQYRLRRTWFGRALAVSLAICGACSYLFISWRTLFPLQSRLSSQAVNVEVVRDAAQNFAFAREGPLLRFSLPVVISGVPNDDYQIDSYAASLETPDGRTSQLNMTGLNLHRSELSKLEIVLESNRTGLRGPALPQFLLDNPRQPVTLRASLYLTLFGNPRERTITLRETPANVMDGIQCFAGYLNNLLCRSPFRWPARMVSQRSGTGQSYLTRLISYSPFPATLDLAPVVWNGTAVYSQTPLPGGRQVTIRVEEPIAYLRRDVAVRDLYLDAR